MMRRSRIRRIYSVFLTYRDSSVDTNINNKFFELIGNLTARFMVANIKLADYLYMPSYDNLCHSLLLRAAIFIDRT